MFGRLNFALIPTMVMTFACAHGAMAEANLFCIAADRNVPALQIQGLLPDDKSAFTKLEGTLKSDLLGGTAFSEKDVKRLTWANDEVRIQLVKVLPDGKPVEVEILAIERMRVVDYGGGYFVRYGGVTVSGRIACTGG